MQWKTAITEVLPNHIRVRGYDIADLIAGVSFGEAIYLVLTGERPTPSHARLMNAILVATIDHSVTAPSACATRFVASGGSPIQSAVAAGLQALGDHHGGAIQQAQQILVAGVQRARTEKVSIADIAEKILTDYKKGKQRVPGLGHPYHKEDPRTVALFTLAREEKMAGPHVELAEALGGLSERISGRHLVINTDMAQAALLADMGIDAGLARGIFLISRAPGLVAHAFEEYTNEKPFRAVDKDEVQYTGAKPRKL